jgi:hypothetical protein
VAPRPLPDWELITGTTVYIDGKHLILRCTDFTNGHVKEWFVQVKNYPRQRRVGEQFAALAFDEKTSAAIKMNSGAVYARIYDFGIETNRAPVTAVASRKFPSPNIEKIIAYQKSALRKAPRYRSMI